MFTVHMLLYFIFIQNVHGRAGLTYFWLPVLPAACIISLTHQRNDQDQIFCLFLLSLLILLLLFHLQMHLHVIHANVTL